MAIRASSSRQIDALVADLGSPRAVTRDAAVARLTVIGARAVDRLLACTGSTSPAAARAAAWRALEAIADARALDPALVAALDADADVAVAAIGVARVFLRGPRGAAAVDGLAAVTLERRRPDAVRLAALNALRDLDSTTVAPVLAALQTDSSASVRTAAAQPGRRRRKPDPLQILATASDSALPDDPSVVQQALADAADAAPLAHLLAVVERARDREAAARSEARSGEWLLVRAAAHVALAGRDSRLALYDLRESLERADVRLPVGFLTALARIGDASCLDAIAAAYAATKETWWRDHLATAFRTIAERQQLTKRHAALRRIEERRPGVLEALWPAPPGRKR